MLNLAAPNWRRLRQVLDPDPHDECFGAASQWNAHGSPHLKQKTLLTIASSISHPPYCLLTFFSAEFMQN
jgi:hypothetical protein